jgi:hypothetical protein
VSALNNSNSSFLIVHHADLGRLGLIRALVSSRIPRAQFVEDAACLEVGFIADSPTAQEIVYAITKLGDVSFELVCLDQTDARRWVFEPTLGLGSVSVDQAANQVIGENELLELVRKSAQNGLKLERLIRKALLSQWDEKFEDLREKSLSLADQARRVG